MTTLTSTTEAERLIALWRDFAKQSLSLTNREHYNDVANELERIVRLLRTSEEARVRAEQERDWCREEAVKRGLELADMRRERDASDAALIAVGREYIYRGEHTGSIRDAITAARSRATGEEKKL